MTTIAAPPPATLNPLTRPWTATSRNWITGVTTGTSKRACNGCGRLLGDVTMPELEAAILGRPLPDVASECGCAGLEDAAHRLTAVAVSLSPMHPRDYAALAAEHDALTDRGAADWHHRDVCAFCAGRSRRPAGEAP